MSRKERADNISAEDIATMTVKELALKYGHSREGMILLLGIAPPPRIYKPNTFKALRQAVLELYNDQDIHPYTSDAHFDLAVVAGIEVSEDKKNWVLKKKEVL